MRVHVCFALGLLFCWTAVCGVACVQDAGLVSTGVWTGEWGSFKPAASKNARALEGQGLSISDCTGQRCTFSVIVQNDAGHGDATGFMEVTSSTDAVAHLLSQKKEYCSLRLTLDPAQSSIAVQQNSGDCSYFETPGASFEHTYALHTRQTYVASDAAACFAATEPASLALCTSKQLSTQQSNWQLLFYEVADLGDQPSGASDFTQQKAAQESLLRSCNAAAQIANCLSAAFTASTEDLNARRAAWLDAVTAAGDPGKASQAAAAIAGSYRHSFQNSDVQGDQFLSTNTLEIAPLPNNEISFAVELEFYNGHSCSLKGTAAYKRSGFFVDQQKTGDRKSPLCVFEILPDDKGVKLADPTGACRMLSCGMRGGYHGAHFSFADRQ